MSELSNRKRKLIRRFAEKKPADVIANELSIPVSRVEEELANLGIGGDLRPRAQSEGRSQQSAFWVLLAVIFLAPFPVSSVLHSPSVVLKSALIQIGSLVLLSSWFFDQYRSPKPSFTRFPLGRPLLAMMLWSGLSISWSSSPYHAFLVWIHWLSCALIFLLATQVLSNRENVRHLFAALTCAGAGIALLGIGQDLLEYEGVIQAVPPAATFMNKNMAAQVVVLLVPAALAIVVTARSNVMVWAAVIAASAQLVFLFYARTRGAWLGLTVEVGLAAVLIAIARGLFGAPLDPVKKRVVPLVATMMLSAFLVHLSPDGWRWPEREGLAYLARATRLIGWLPPKEPPERRSAKFKAGSEEQKGEDHELNERPATPSVVGATSSMVDRITLLPESDSLGLRFTWWRNAAELLREHPLVGVGLNNFQTQYPKTQKTGRADRQLELNLLLEYAHSDLFQLTAELGIPFLLILLWTLWESSRAALAKLSIAREAEARTKSAGRAGESSRASWVILVSTVAALSALAGGWANACFSFPAYRAVPPLLWAIHAAVLCSHNRPAGWEREDRGKEGRARLRPRTITFNNRPMLGAFAIGGALTAIAWSVAQLRCVRADYYFREQRKALVREDHRGNIHFGKKVVALNPFRVEARDYMGRALIDIGEYELAERELLAFNDAFPHATYNLYYLARVYEKLGQSEKGLAHVKHALEILPGDGMLHDSLGKLYRAQGKHKDALSAFRHAAELAPQKYEVLHNLGTQAHQNGHIDEARRAFLRAVELNDRYEHAHKWLGLTLYFDLNRKEKGIVHLKRALELDSNITNANQLRKVIAEYEGGR